MSGGGKQAPSKGEITMARIAGEQVQDFKDRWVPVEDRYLKSVRDLDNAGAKGLARNSAIADARSASGKANNALKNRTLASGAGPNSGRFADLQIKTGRAEAANAGTASVGADRQSKQRHLSGMVNAMKLGKGLNGMANLGFRNAASVSAQNAATRANYETAEFTQNMDFASTVVGAVGGAAEGAMADKYGTGAWDGVGLSGTKNWWDVTSGPRRL